VFKRNKCYDDDDDDDDDDDGDDDIRYAEIEIYKIRM
jgi:hypothetical protein